MNITPTNENSRQALKNDFIEFFGKDLFLNGLFAQYRNIQEIELEAMWAIANLAYNVNEMRVGLLLYELNNCAYNDNDIDLNFKNLEILENIFQINVSPLEAGGDGWLTYKQAPQFIPVFVSENSKNSNIVYYRKPSSDLLNIRIPLEIGTTTISKSWMQLNTFGVLARMPYECYISKKLAVWFVLDKHQGLFKKTNHETYELICE